MDDLVEHLPRDPKGNAFRKALIRIDIEGMEPYAFENAHRLFKKVDVQVILMEWEVLQTRPAMFAQVEKMIKLLTLYGFSPYHCDTKRILNVKEWRLWQKWPIDVIWKKFGVFD
jgi:hypothetical protein